MHMLFVDLSNLCKLLSRVVGAVDPLVTAFERHVKNKGISVMHLVCISRALFIIKLGYLNSDFPASLNMLTFRFHGYRDYA